jgi:hypothetical protein
MISTQTVRLAKLGAEIEMARKAGDITRLEHLAGQHQRLLESVYGSPLAK